MRPYLPFDRAERGVLATAEKLFQIKFRQIENPDVWHPSVTAWEVLDGGKVVGRFYLDMHPREGKDKWFSATPVVTGVRGRYLPEAGLICNFPRPEVNAAGEVTGPNLDPGLMQYSDVVTYFHEFGHLMHAILGGQTEWAGLSGFATEGDFIEVPSQMLEDWVYDKRVLKLFSTVCKTCKPVPDELIDKAVAAHVACEAPWLPDVTITWKGSEAGVIPPK